MRCSQHTLWRASLLLWALLLRCEAAVDTEIQAGPLYRVVGTPLSISCHVSGFSNKNAKQDFEFKMEKPGHSNSINIISSNSPHFSYTSHKDRVDSNDIYLTYVNQTSVLFEIRSLRKDDEGEYTCQVVNSEYVYNGIYSAQTTLKVISDSLSVSSSEATTSLSYNEGEDLTLACQASTNTFQHTHLSLAWYLHKDGEDNPQPIISLDKDFTLSPGQGFEQRYNEGLISLDKLGGDTYRLKMAQLEPSDQGKIFCRAQEWIQDPDRSWYLMLQKDAEKITLTVKAKEVVPDMSSLVVKISTPQTTLQEGQELSLSCSIDTQNQEGRFFSLAWLRGSNELARIGPTGILSVRLEYRGREKEGELRATRTGTRDYRLMLKPVKTKDQGEYVCRAWPQDRSLDGTFSQGAAQDSSSQMIIISPEESGLSVEMQDTDRTVTEGGRLRLACKAAGVKGQLSVTWQHKSASSPTALITRVISLHQDGVTEKADEYTSRKVIATRPAADNFILELDEVTPSDSGVYQCTVTERKSNNWTHSQSQSATVTVNPIGSLVEVSLKSRNTQVTIGDTVKLMCQVKGPRVPITLTWSLERNGSTEDIVTLNSDGAINWSEGQQQYQIRVENQNNMVVYYMQIISVSQKEEGVYGCKASAFLLNAHKELHPSNLLSVRVQKPESKLTLLSSPSMTQNINTDIQIRCSVASNTSVSSLFDVAWLLQQGPGSKIIISSDRKALVTFGPEVELSSSQRISMRRTDGPSFELTIRQARISDKGTYVCQVVEWLQDPHGEWYSLPKKSVTTKLVVTEPANDLLLDKNKQQLTCQEGEEVELQCNIISDASGASFFYKVTWLYAPDSSSNNHTLVELEHTGLLKYPENQVIRSLQGRLHLSRPTQNNFQLSIQGAHEEDGGIYWCQVEQYQLDNKGVWQQKASESTDFTTLAVNLAEPNLFLEKKEVPLNVSKTDHFSISCIITRQSSNESKFQVTWFWHKDTQTKQQPIFTAYTNSTLQTKLKDGVLSFGHPLPGQYILTVLKPEDSGMYFCEVEEWLPSLTHGWRKVAMDKSGNLAVTVFSKEEYGAISSGTWISIIVVIVIVLLLVILLLLVKICKSKDLGGKKSGPSLWTEQVPLKG
ncbi:immunoglobulin superfamily member 3-like isoform X2 [Melanotaenia boesemani]|uniref:immunoglobulin superfamily member 3-like isoform X2 n=1 Tax=Melanotaenia boesemani TaxID=1250792 RepID=UPI001C04EFCB|nr:immunoglobulin superfamily member 3-like isoform X2 [Melanotaenia boesemani]